MEYDIPDSRFNGELVSNMHHYKPDKSQEELVAESLENPIGTPKLSVMAEGKKNIVVIASDHTRPVPSKIIMPQMLAEIRKGNPDANITILISTGCHRDTAKEELEAKFGPEIMANENIVVHNCDTSENIYCGKLPSGGGIYLNKSRWTPTCWYPRALLSPTSSRAFPADARVCFRGLPAAKPLSTTITPRLLTIQKAAPALLTETLFTLTCCTPPVWPAWPLFATLL